MTFDAFDRTETEQNRKAAMERWGATAAWDEYVRREEASAPGQLQDAGAQLMALLAEMSALRPLLPEDAAVQAKVAALQQHITRHFYTCTDEILAGLGQMYAADERFAANIDAAGGEGCAAFAAQAIAAYCRR